MGGKAKEMVGKKFGVVRVLRLVGGTKKHKKFEVQCSVCDEKFIRLGENIRRSVNAKGAGCICKYSYVRNGLSNHPAYKTWEGMIARCYHENHDSFFRYGGRGIKVCDEWVDSPAKFIEWMEESGWIRGMDLDRRDNAEGYSPENCRVVSRTDNLNNRSNTIRVEIGGEILPLSEAARKFGLNYTTLKHRVECGWTNERLISGVRHYRRKDVA